MRRVHTERHRTDRSNWLRAAVLGANDGILSTSSLLVGIAASDALPSSLAIAGIASLVAGAFSMGAGEFVSVSSQKDLERADLSREARELEGNPAQEEAELAAIYRARGLSAETARTVARELTAADPLTAHARDELGLSMDFPLNPLQAALASAAAFSCGSALPLVLVSIAPASLLVPIIVGASLLGLTLLGALGALVGGAPVLRGVVRVALWGVLAMTATYLLGHFSRGLG